MSESGGIVLYDHAAPRVAEWLERVGARPSFLRSIAEGGGATA